MLCRACCCPQPSGRHGHRGVCGKAAANASRADMSCHVDLSCCSGPAAAPSQVLDMSIAEFVAGLQPINSICYVCYFVIFSFCAGRAAAPSQVVDMGIAEFVARLQPGCHLPPLLYKPHEHYYMQVGKVWNLMGVKILIHAQRPRYLGPYCMQMCTQCSYVCGSIQHSAHSCLDQCACF